MGKIVVQLSVSLDGFIAGPDGGLDWGLVDDELLIDINRFVGGLSALLEGRVMYELMSGAWPAAGEGPGSPPPMAEFAGIWRRIPKVVYSRTLEAAGDLATIVRRVDPDEVTAMKAAATGDLAVGGAEIAAEFQRLGLVDQYRLYLHPVALGRGKPLFTPGATPVELRLIETRPLASGVVLVHYATTTAPAATV